MQSEVEVLGARDREAGGSDGSGGVAGGVAAAAESRPQAASVGELEQGASGVTFGDDVLVEAQFSPGTRLATAASTSRSPSGRWSAVPARTVTGTGAVAAARSAAARSVGSGSIAMTSVTLAG